MSMTEDNATLSDMTTSTNGSFTWTPESAFSGPMTITISPAVEDPSPETGNVYWEGILGVEGLHTGDGRYLMPGEITERELPLTLMAQTVNQEGHQGAQVAGKITEVWRQPNPDLGSNAIEIWGSGPFDDSEFGAETARMVDDQVLRGVSLDMSITQAQLLDPETFEIVEPEQFDLLTVLSGDLIQGISGKIMGATLCPFPAFENAVVSLKDTSVKDGNQQEQEVLT